MNERLKEKLLNKRGFTLIELIIVIAIIAILAGLIAPSLIGFLSTGKETADNADVKTLNLATALYMIQNPDKMVDGDIFHGTASDEEREKILLDSGYITQASKSRMTGDYFIWNKSIQRWESAGDSGGGNTEGGEDPGPTYPKGTIMDQLLPDKMKGEPQENAWYVYGDIVSYNGAHYKLTESAAQFIPDFIMYNYAWKKLQLEFNPALYYEKGDIVYDMETKAYYRRITEDKLDHSPITNKNVFEKVEYIGEEWIIAE